MVVVNPLVTLAMLPPPGSGRVVVFQGSGVAISRGDNGHWKGHLVSVVIVKLNDRRGCLFHLIVVYFQEDDIQSW